MCTPKSYQDSWAGCDGIAHLSTRYEYGGLPVRYQAEVVCKRKEVLVQTADVMPKDYTRGPGQKTLA